MSDDFYAARDRLMASHAGRKEPRRRSSGPASGLLQLVIGTIWGAVFMWCVVFLNANYDRIKQAVDAKTELAGTGTGMFAFIALSLLFLVLGVLRRLFFSSFRLRRGWSLIIGFFLGWAVVAVTGKLVAV